MPERVRPQPTSTAASSRTPINPGRAHAGSSECRDGGRAGALSRREAGGATGGSVTVAMAGASTATVRAPWGPAGRFLRARSVSAERVERRGDHRADADLERGLDDRREARIVVGRDVVGDPAGLLGPAVGAGVGAADVPEDRGHAPLGPERAEVLARRHGRRELADGLVAELRTQRGG